MEIKKLANVYLWLTLVVGCAIVMLWWLKMPLLGDDLLFACDYAERGDTLYGLPGQMLAVWTGCNARSGDMLNTLWLAVLPRPLVAFISAVMLWAMMWAMMRMAGVHRDKPLAGAIMLAGIAWALPWWDMTHFVCFFNYLWGMALGALALCGLLFVEMKKDSWMILLLPVAAMATASHEALGVPLIIGIIVWRFTAHNLAALRGMRLWWFLAMAVGACFTLTSPASYSRFADSFADDRCPLLWLLITTLPLVIVLWIVIICTFCLDRKRLMQLVGSRWIIFATTATLSSVFVIIGGVEGRSGWFAQCFALVALMYQARDLRIMNRDAGWSMLLVSAVLVTTIYTGRLGISRAERMNAAAERYHLNPEKAAEQLQKEGVEDWDIESLPAIIVGKRDFNKP